MREQRYCCICDQPVDPPYNILGQRVYCAHHFEVVNRPSPGFWRATAIQIIGMVAFSALVALIASQLPELDRTAQIGVGLFLAIVPSLLWMWYFYRQDRLEPEPKGRILMVFGLALLLMDAVGYRVIGQWFQLATWASTDTFTAIGSAVLITGMVRQAVMYLAIRASVYNTPEYDERMDGIVYGTIAGLGVAALLNLRFIIDNQGVDLVPGVVQTVTTALAQASFGGLMGYFMAEAKFEHRPPWWVALGFALAAVANGLLSWLIDEVSAVGLEVEYWRSLVFGLLLALAAFGLLAVLMRRTTEVTLGSGRSLR